jgi:hypothetical protein
MGNAAGHTETKLGKTPRMKTNGFIQDRAGLQWSLFMNNLQGTA